MVMAGPLLRVAVINDFLHVFEPATDWSRLAGVATVDFFHDHLDSADKAAVRLAPYDIVVTERERTHFDAGLLERLPRLRLLVTTGTHNRYIDFAAAQRLNITVCKTEGILHAAPELAMTLILALMRRVVIDNDSLRAGGWQTGLGRSLRGKTLGIVGLGVTGPQMVRLAEAFGMLTVAWSPHLTDERARVAGTRRVPFDELLTTADVVSVHMVLADSTRGLIGARELGLMKTDAYLVNTSRGALVDEPALIEALRERRIAGAGLDVYATEPLPKEHPLRGLNNVILTPHTGYVTDEQYALCFGQAVENILAFAAGQPVRVMTHT
jgi:phosphoglycerate dehydrogenase-like enzyme